MNNCVSIITPSYNTASYISDTIKSVQAQSYTNWEMIIVDDCSTDHTDEIVKPFLSDGRIRYLKNEHNSGAAISRNYALREAKGRFIAFLDSDDLWHPDKLREQIDFMETQNCFFSYTNYEEIDENGHPFGVLVTGPKKINRRGMYRYCWMGCLTVMYDRNKIGPIQIQDIKKNNDYAMWLDVCKKADCLLLNKNLAKYRKRSGSISRNSIRTMIGWHYRLWKEAEGKSAFCSLWRTIVNLLFGFYKKQKYVKSIK